MPYKDPEKRRECKREWARRNAAWTNPLRNARRTLKRQTDPEYHTRELNYTRRRRLILEDVPRDLIDDLYTQPCFYCGDEPVRPSVDHLVPISKGGTNHLSNLVPSCLFCNVKKNNRTLEEFYAL